MSCRGGAAWKQRVRMLSPSGCPSAAPASGAEGVRPPLDLKTGSLNLTSITSDTPWGAPPAPRRRRWDATKSSTKQTYDDFLRQARATYDEAGHGSWWDNVSDRVACAWDDTKCRIKSAMHMGGPVSGRPAAGCCRSLLLLLMPCPYIECASSRLKQVSKERPVF